MRVALFGASGMVGQGVLRECLLDPGVEGVLAIGRSPSASKGGAKHPKLREIVRANLSDYADLDAELSNLDACFFCLGISSNGMTESEYEPITRGITLAAAQALVRLNPRMTFVYVSGKGTDSSEKGRLMWARVKGKTENELLRLPFAAAYMFRPGLIVPLHGAISKTPAYRIVYAMTKPLLPLVRAAFPNQVVTTEQIGHAMLNVARSGYGKPVLESGDIRAAALQPRFS